MTRSEEELRVGTEKREAGRARLRKYVVTEQVQKTVPVRREEVRVEREPITDANREQALSGADITEGEHEVVLHEEESWSRSARYRRSGCVWIRTPWPTSAKFPRRSARSRSKVRASTVPVDARPANSSQRSARRCVFNAPLLCFGHAL